MIFAAMAAAGISEPRRVVNVGDTTRDLHAGAEAGVGANIGVLSGAHDRARLESAPYTHVIDSIEDLPTLIETELGS